MITSKINIKCSKLLADAYISALNPEKDFKTERASYTLKKSLTGVKIEIKATDSTAFRSVTNSITSVLALVDKNEKRI